MLIIPCPNCGPRPSGEFIYYGELLPRPSGDDVTEESWRNYLYTRRNPVGAQLERWFHHDGCRCFLQLERDTVTNELTDPAP